MLKKVTSDNVEGEGLESGLHSDRLMLCGHKAEGLGPGTSLADAIKATKSDAMAARAGSGAW